MDISGLRERNDTAMTVSELNNFIKSMFDGNRLLNSIHVRGEISNFVNHRSGHFYFSLKDEGAQIKAVMFRSSAVKLKFMPENGMKVTVFGSISVFPRDGVYQMYISSMQPDGIGALYLAYEQLKARLESEGLFSEIYKKPLPEFPEKIGVITSPTGAAIRDIINVLGRRYPLATVYIYPALVQGECAAKSLIAGIDYFDKSKLVDTIIIGRGGGSIEDLWEFNSEELARRIFDCRIPVISAVGHETDFTICDFVSDMRAPTPSAAAELAVPDVRELSVTVDMLSDRLDRALMRVAEKSRDRLTRILEGRTLGDFSSYLQHLSDRVMELMKEACSAYESTVAEKKLAFLTNVSKLDALNPLSVMARGYSMVQKDGKILSEISKVEIGDTITIRLRDGRIDAIAQSKTEEYR
jgi:exodeoxyribonuclease VII large subunit